MSDLCLYSRQKKMLKKQLRKSNRSLLTVVADMFDRLGERIMSKLQELKDGMSKIDVATNKLSETVTTEVLGAIGDVKTKIDDLRSRVTGGISDAEASSIVSDMDALTERLNTAETAAQSAVDQLKGIAADPENPVPDTAPAGGGGDTVVAGDGA